MKDLVLHQVVLRAAITRLHTTDDMAAARSCADVTGEQGADFARSVFVTGVTAPRAEFESEA